VVAALALLLAAVLILVVQVFYYCDQRVGNGIFSNVKPRVSATLIQTVGSKG